MPAPIGKQPLSSRSSTSCDSARIKTEFQPRVDAGETLRSPAGGFELRIEPFDHAEIVHVGRAQFLFGFQAGAAHRQALRHRLFRRHTGFGPGVLRYLVHVLGKRTIGLEPFG